MQIKLAIQADTITCINPLLNTSIQLPVNTLLTLTDKNLLNGGQFCVLKKCYGKFECLIDEMLFFKERRPTCKMALTLGLSLLLNATLPGKRASKMHITGLSGVTVNLPHVFKTYNNYYPWSNILNTQWK